MKGYGRVREWGVRTQYISGCARAVYVKRWQHISLR